MKNEEASEDAFSILHLKFELRNSIPVVVGGLDASNPCLYEFVFVPVYNPCPGMHVVNPGGQTRIPPVGPSGVALPMAVDRGGAGE